MTDDEIIRTVADDLPVGIWVGRAPGGEMVYANPHFAEIFGTAADAQVRLGESSRLYGLHTRSGELYPEEELPFVQALERRTTVVKDDLVVHRPDGSKVHLRASARPILDGRGGVSHVVIALIDITRDVEAELRRVETEKRLHRAERLEGIGTLAGGIAHDFNNLLSTVKIATRSLRQHESCPHKLEVLGHIDEVADSAAQLTRSLLGFARRRPQRAVRLSVNEVARTVWSLVERTLGHRFRTSLELGADPDLVVGDFSQLEQVVLNLLVNARDAMEHGGQLTLRTGRLRVSAAEPHGPLAPGDYVVLEVSDTGPGIPTAIRDRIFEPYFTTKNQGPVRGTGMGLATVYGIVTSHAGCVEVIDNQPTGTTMRVVLPGAARQGQVRPPPLEPVEAEQVA